nr:hypothetical protein [Tanacetum cinerariifolium]
MLKSSYKAEDGVIISIPPLVGGVADVVVEIKGTGERKTRKGQIGSKPDKIGKPKHTSPLFSTKSPSKPMDKTPLPPPLLPLPKENETHEFRAYLTVGIVIQKYTEHDQWPRMIEAFFPHKTRTQKAFYSCIKEAAGSSKKKVSVE